MTLYGDPLKPSAWRTPEMGYRARYLRLLKQINTADVAWPLTADILREMADAGIEIDETAIEIASKLGAHRLASADARRQANRLPAYHKLSLATAGSIVYYVRCGDVIKIGTTTDPAGRFRSIVPNEILAFEPGTFEHEHCRHRQFGHLRGHGEYFRQAPELLEHCRHLRKLHGDPDPAWRTTATRPKRPELPAPASGETMTAKQAEEVLGVKAGTVWAAARRGQIPVVGKVTTGTRSSARVFYVEHLRTLHGTC